MNYKYKVSVIVPIYNMEAYLKICLDSLVEQTISDEDLEVVLIDDGSTDRSAEICKEYCDKYSIFHYYYIENSGVSKARNFGINHANGKYIMFLDSDDKLTAESIEKIYDFFEKVYDEVDLVTYFIQPYKDNELLKVHERYQAVLTHTGVYDLEKYPYVIQTTMNICIKNMGSNNILFNEKMKSQEDQEYINRILATRLKIGYCAQACYMYNRSNEGSAVNTKFHAYYLFEPAMEYFENLFANYEDKVPAYFQALFFHDLRWKLIARNLYPFHYDEKEFENAMTRIKKLLARVDTDIIVKNPSISKEHMHYWLNLKPNAFPVHYVSNTGVDIVADGKTIEKNKQVMIYLISITKLDNGKFRIRGYLPLSAYNYINDTPELYALENSLNEIKLNLYLSSFGYFETDIMTNKFFGFTYDVNPDEVNELSFKLILDSFKFDVHIEFLGRAVFKHGIRRYSFARDNYIVSYYNDSISFDKKSIDEVYKFEKDNVELIKNNSYLKKIKNKAIDYRHNHRVWIYSDFTSVLKDNAYYQFINDFNKDDGVERYYIYSRPLEEISSMFTDEQKEYLVEYRSEKHKILYLASEIVFSSFYSRCDYSPFETNVEEWDVIDIEHFKLIYMQHGILHASHPIKYSADKTTSHKIVVSSYFEVENLTTKYNYEEDELIKCGMPRYTRINRDSVPKNRILLAPSWRSYFAQTNEENRFEINVESFCKSDYYKGFYAFVSSEELAKKLEENDIILDIKMHPVIKNTVSELFKCKSDRINIVLDDVNLEDYKMFITDFSSFVYDYAYLNRPILYFIPDYLQFKSGMNLYRDIDLPYDKAFGELAKTADEAVLMTEKVIDNNFIPEEKYAKRMESFYLPLGNCEEDLYKYVTETMLNK